MLYSQNSWTQLKSIVQYDIVCIIDLYKNYNVVIHVGNMWAQNWENIYGIVQPFKDKPEIEVTPALKAQVTFTNHSTVIPMMSHCIKQWDLH